MTPMQEQYHKLKSQYKDTVLLFRLGDFYEAFNEDAELLSNVLGITLTGRGKDENRTPMAGIPYHALPNYIPKLIEAGIKVAIAEQMEEASAGKLVERQVTKVITPGTVIDENSLDNSKNNFIASIYAIFEKTKTYYSLVLCDLTTGELKGFNTNNIQILKNEIQKFKPAEIIASETQSEDLAELGFRLELLKESKFDFDKVHRQLLTQFEVQNLRGFGLNDENQEHQAIISAGSALIDYLKECQKGEVKHIKSIKLYSYKDHMQLDPETIRNLELLYPMSGTNYSTTLFGILNRCQNSMGQRKLRQWILTPLINEDYLMERLDSVEFFFKERILESNIRESVKKISDIERIVGRIGVGSANPKDLIALKLSLQKALELKSLLSAELIPTRLNYLNSQINSEDLEKIINIISEAIDDDPSAMLNQGGVIKLGFNPEVDELKNLRNGSKQILAEIQRREVERTQISSLKISFNNVFGYYIEITRSHLNKVPSDYIRKQTLANAERFITEELKELETKILNAEEKLIKIETELFIEIRNKISEFSKHLLQTSDAIAEIDVLSTFSEISREYRYVKPQLSSEKYGKSIPLEVISGRHPVVERIVKEFSPNGTCFDEEDCIDIITGPNMSGKSTYIRQVALIILMAQIGCFVPAESLKFALTDRIFTRVGAGDNLSKGESTFMVEMSETANILNNATSQSLIILDEVGRGTSTYDGVAIAWSIVEYIHEKIKAKTLFATHYHELTELEEKYKGIKNCNVKVVEVNGEIMFTHKIVEGSANKSYGVHVAKLAGVPSEIVTRANEILDRFETDSSSEIRDAGKISNTRSLSPVARSPRTPRKIHPEQLGLI